MSLVGGLFENLGDKWRTSYCTVTCCVDTGQSILDAVESTAFQHQCGPNRRVEGFEMMSRAITSVVQNASIIHLRTQINSD
ncbi:hypothetical protein HPB47_020580 [Ixodes persulcatus]|uniref:Uncharacterized protein n=1 Tax=Ixodes persulcatus TaxID=34615 RepID=A0AC60QF10_IXOPE|nr:hypothetical protein HPB47_020580 [Ixodes persulcatus]